MEKKGATYTLKLEYPVLGGASDALNKQLAEAALNGKVPGDAPFRTAAEAAAKAIDPLEDHQTNADYRRDLVRAVVRRALEQNA